MRGVPVFDVYLRFESDADREAVLGWLRPQLPNGPKSLIEEGGDVWLRFENFADESGAVGSSQHLIGAACRATGVQRVDRKVGGWK